ncbi:HAD family hydrolase [Streptomyces sp. 1114.5]|uniref:HAD family hydrolase n=1 Tax=Streptomyces sp. 1114.5 TaxID=1938830 RepID=UPI000EAF3CB2|nr:HAD family hydrolase [Streptomyces sp. 1114.5]
MRRLVLIDLDDTLISRHGAMTAWVARFSADRQLTPEAAQFVENVLRDRAQPETFDVVRDHLRLPESSAELWSAYVAGIAARVACAAGTLSRLDLLRAAGWSVGVLTNGASDIQRAKLSAAKILDHVDAVCISEETRARKPDPEAFRTAAARCGFMLPADAWMVGDNPETDIAGASAAGLRTVWVSAGGTWATPGLAPDHISPTVVEALDFLLGRPESTR